MPMNKNVLDTDLSGKVAVVTGAGGVLCSAFAKTLARAGAKVALLDLNEEAAQSFADEITAEGGVAKAYKCNVLDKACLLYTSMLYTLVGLTLFLTGVNVGFMPAGNYIGKQLAELPYNWVLVPLGMLIGYYIVKAEPAVLVLNKQVEEITGGAISQKVMMAGLSIGMSVSLGLSMVRVLTGVSLLWFLVPGYALALGLSFLVPKIFTAIAFDSGGVASGPMTATFLLPFAMGACEAVGGNILTDAFGDVYKRQGCRCRTARIHAGGPSAGARHGTPGLSG